MSEIVHMHARRPIRLRPSATTLARWLDAQISPFARAAHRERRRAGTCHIVKAPSRRHGPAAIEVIEEEC